MTPAASISPSRAAAGSARALPALGAVMGLLTLLSLVVCLDALVLHDVSWPIAVIAFAGAASGLAGLIRTAVQLARLAAASRDAARGLGAAERIPGRSGVLVVPDPQPRAFCAGLLSPRVVVTDGALRTLTPAALDAVVAHERHHARRRDGLRRGLADAVASGLFLIPGARGASERYGALLELKADRAAARTPSSARGLATAMLSLDATGSGVAPERVDRLLGLPVRVRVGGWTLTSAGSLSVVLATTATVCTLTTGCVDIFLLREGDATAHRLGVLPVLGLAAVLLVVALGRLRLRPARTTPGPAKA